MDRRTALTLIGGASFAPLASGGIARALAQATPARTITYGQSTSSTALGPAYGSFNNYPGSYEVAICLYDRLIDFDNDLKFTPQLAASWEMAADLKSCTFKLRPNAKFHDGTPVDGAAVKSNIERMMDKERNPTNRPLWDPIAGCDVVDPLTVVVRTKATFAALLNSLAHASGSMVSPTALAKDGERSMLTNPVGAGPYMIESFTAGQQVALKAFDGYWGGRPKTDRLVFQFIPEAATRISALRTGAVDVIDSVPVQLVAGLKREANLEVITRPGLRPMGLAINLSREPYDDVRVRRALNLAVPVATIAERVFFGFAKASDSPLAFNTQAYRKCADPVYDQARAKALLIDAGFKENSGVMERNGKRLTMTLLASEGLFPGDLQVAEICARSFQQIGVEVSISKIERSAYFEQLRQDRANLKWDAAMFGFNPSNASGLYHLESLFKANPDDASRPEVWNIGRYRKKEVDDLLAQANVTVDPARQAELLGQVQKIVWDDAPYVWLQVNENVSAVRKGLVGTELWPIVFTVVRRAQASA